jgi:hypothetical protein
VRGDASDVNLLRQLRAGSRSGKKISGCSSRRSPRVVKQTCACIDVAWTGRMPLAIAALGQGVPVVATIPGQVRRAVRRFRARGPRMAPRREPTTDAIADLLPTRRTRRQLHARIAARLPAQRALAERNIRTLVP